MVRASEAARSGADRAAQHSACATYNPHTHTRCFTPASDPVQIRQSGQDPAASIFSLTASPGSNSYAGELQQARLRSSACLGWIKPKYLVTEMSTDTTCRLLALVLGCFAVYWQTYLHPLWHSGVQPPSSGP